MNRNIKTICALAISSCGFIYSTALGQDDAALDEEVYELSPFVIDTTEDSGYYASQSLAGGRTATDIKNTGTSIEVITKDLLNDIGGKTVEDFLQYTTGGEVGGAMGNFVGATEGDFGGANTTAARTAPHKNTRLRGIGSPDYVRNYYKTGIPGDSYNTERVDINRGANSMLFGLGSPAGLINFGYSRAGFYESNEVEIQVGSGGDRPSYRGSFDFNREILDDKLAVRVSGLHNRLQYRQEPSYKNDDRLYVAATFKPFKNTTLRAHFEDGKIKGNAPDTVLPSQAFDTFIDYRMPVDIYDNLQRFGDIEGPTYAQWQELSAEDQAKYSYWKDYDGVGILDHGDAWGWGMVYDGSNGTDPAFGIRPQIAENLYEHSPTDAVGDPFWDASGIADSPVYMLFYRNMRNHEDVGGIGTTQGFTSLDGFDFSKYNFGGASDYYEHDFQTYNLAAEQLFWDGKVGIDVGYDYEEVDNDAVTNFNGWKGEFMIDINKTLPLPATNADGSIKRDADGNVVVEVMQNPNFGRPVYFSENGRSTSFEKRETLRATAFLKYNFAEEHSDSKVLKWLGNHTLTFLADKFTEEYRTEHARLQSYSDDFNLAWHTASGNADDPSDGYRRLTKMVYMGPAIQTYINDPFNPNTHIDINDIIITPSSYDLISEPTTGINYWSLGPDAEGSRWYHAANPDAANGFYGTSSGNEFVTEPDAYVGDRRETFEEGTLEGRWTKLKDNQTRKTIVKSLAVNLQSMFFNDHLVANLGYREDRVENWLNTVVPERWDLFKDGIVTDASWEGDRTAVVDPKYFTPEDGMFTEIDKGPEGTGSFGYGGVLHLPKNLKVVQLPEWLDLSVHYNYSKNFVADASRNTFKPAKDGGDWYWGALSSPVGESRDVGFTVNLNNNKFIARFNWYKSTIANGDAGLGSTANQLINWAIRARQWAQQDLDLDDPDGNGVIDVNADGNPHNHATERYDINRLFQVLDGTQWVMDDGFWDAKIENGFMEMRDNGLQKYQVWFPGLVDTQDLVSKGFEMNLTYNPTKNWRISFNATNIESVSSNVGPLTEHILNRFFESYNQIKSYTLWQAHDTQGGAPMSNWMGRHVINYYQKKLQEGSSTNEVRDWYANLITNYTFRDGALEGFSVGGAIRYQSAGTIGYPIMDYEVSPGTVMSVPDVNSPWEGDANWNIDLNAGYKRKIWDNKIDWTCRLHLKNVNNFSNDNVTVFRANYDGTPATVRWDPPLTIFLTNTFSF